MSLNTSFCTIAYRKQEGLPLPKILEQVKEAGYGGAELWWPHVEKLSEAQLAETKATLARLGLKVPMLSGYLGNFNLPMTNREEMLERTRQAAPVAAKLGAPLLRAFAGWTCECSSLTAGEPYWKFNLEGFSEMCRIAGDYGLDIAIETHSGTLCDSVAGCLRLAEHCGPRIKFNLQLDDIAKNSKLPNGLAVYRALGERVAHAHVPPVLEGAEREEWSGVLKAMQAGGFPGFVSIEHCKGDGDTFEIAKTGRRLLREITGA